MRRFVLLIVAAGFIAGCSKEAGPPIDISGVRILAPVPGSRMGVAYMTIANNSGDTMIITAARSPQFERVEMHETLIEDGVSTMRELEALTIEDGTVHRFETGGAHLMLIGPAPVTAPGSPVTIEIEHSGGLLIVSATMQDRIAGQ